MENSGYTKLDFSIPELRLPEFVPSVLGDVLVRVLKEGQFDSETGRFHLDVPLSLKQKAARSILWAICDYSELIANLNCAIHDMQDLPSSSSLTRKEQVVRLKFLTRIFFYEFARSKDIYNQFLDTLEYLGLIEKEGQRVLRKQFYDIFEPYIKSRDRLIHSLTEWKQDSVLDMLASPSPLDEHVLPATFRNEAFETNFPKAVHDRVFYLHQAGKHLSGLLQTVFDGLASEELSSLEDPDDAEQ